MASSSSSCSTKHDVFLSFRGEDTRRTFTCHLYAALCRKDIDTFMDDEKIERGDEIPPTLLAAIEGSKISIVIFSKNYASSKWCLNELTKIIECKSKMQHIVLPVFYDVEPTEVRKQSDTYKDAFAKHEKDNQVNVQKWREALREAADFAGWNRSNTRLDSHLIENIVEDVQQKLNTIISPQIPSGLVGVENQIAHIESLLCNEVMSTRIVGIWGMGGIGKTTLADILFKRLSSQYQGCGFVTNVREKWNLKKNWKMRDDLLGQILGDQNLHIKTPDISSSNIVQRLQRKKVLIVLDDVSNPQQIKYLVGQENWYGKGSRIIFTARDRNVLPGNENVGLYQVMPLNDKEALRLFCSNVFQQDYPKNEFERLSEMAVAYARGIPLAIIVLGSLLSSKNQEEWKNTLKQYEKDPIPGIHDVLRWSFEELCYKDKQIFLDIACFFKGEKKEHIINLAYGCSSDVNIGLGNLQNKSLITISEKDHVQMHDLIQEMGWYVVQGEFIEQPEKWSRLWDHNHIHCVLASKKGNDFSLQGISLNMSQIEEVQVNPETFARMPSLRLLKFYTSGYPFKCNMSISKGLESLPDRLRYLRWDHFPLNALPPSFCAKMLVEVDLRYSSVEKLWEGDQDVANLKRLRLNDCHCLLELPYLKKAAKLEEINLASCRSLRHVPSYILSLDSVVQLNLFECKQLRCIRSEKPSESLQVLILSRCDNLVEFSVASEKLNRLNLDDTAIEELSLSVGQPTTLLSLSLDIPKLVTLPNNLYQLVFDSLLLDGCSRLQKLPSISADTPLSLRRLSLNDCSRLSKLPDNLGLLSTLESLSLARSGVKTLPVSIKLLHNLRTLNVSSCKELRSLPELPLMLSDLKANGCTSLETVTSIAPTALMKNFGGQKKSVLLGQKQQPKNSLRHGRHVHYRYHEVFDFVGCRKLDENARETILGEAAIRIKYAAYVSSMGETSADPYCQLYLCSEACDPKTFHYTCCLNFLKRIALRSSVSNQIWNEFSSSFTANFNGIRLGDLKCLVFALESNKEENKDADFDTSMQRICMQQGLPIPLLRYKKRWDMNVEVCLPGNRVPDWIRYRTTETPFVITIELPPSSHLLDFAFCLVLEESARCYKFECECCLEYAEGNNTSERHQFTSQCSHPIEDAVCLCYVGRTYRGILEKLEKIRTTDRCTSFNPKLSFQFFLKSYGESIGGLTECGVWPIYASDLESENLIQSVKLGVQPDDLGGGSTTGIEKQDELLEHHLLKQRKRKAPSLKFLIP